MNNTISFTGRIRLTDYTGGGRVTKCFTTTKEHDQLIKQAAEQIVSLDTLRVMTDEQVKMFHSLMEQITNSTIPFIKNEKGFHRTNNGVTYADRFIRPWSGIHLDIKY